MTISRRDSATASGHCRVASALCLLLLLLSGCGEKQHDQLSGNADSAASQLTELDPGSMDAFLVAGSPSVVEFGGKRCIPCMEMRETLAQLHGRRPAVRLGIVYWEDNPELFETWKVGLIPAQIVFDRQGREITRHRGAWELDSLIAQIDELEK